jgi:hypothetical protein
MGTFYTGAHALDLILVLSPKSQFIDGISRVASSQPAAAFLQNQLQLIFVANRGEDDDPGLESEVGTRFRSGDGCAWAAVALA